jgi:catechol 2,3-dioxygenase-like lactoylglutathione lyase family enzyme
VKILLAKESEYPMTQMKLELVPVPVTDIDRSKSFYVDQVGFHLDHDDQPSEGVRVCQLTPTGSGCSILLGSGMGEITAMPAGTLKGLHLVVADLVALRDELIGRGVPVGDVIEYPGGFKFAPFNDPDGNMWMLQEVPPGR